MRAGTATVLLCHGLGPDDMNRFRVDDYGYALEVNDELQRLLVSSARPDLVVKGHTHRAGVAVVDGLTIVDAGTLRRDHDPCVSLLDLEQKTLTRWDLDVPHFAWSTRKTTNLVPT